MFIQPAYLIRLKRTALGLKKCTGESDLRSVCQQRERRGKGKSRAAYADLETVRRAELFQRNPVQAKVTKLCNKPRKMIYKNEEGGRGCFFKRHTVKTEMKRSMRERDGMWWRP